MKQINKNSLLLGDCLDVLRNIPEHSIDLIYLDPPFFTNKTQEQLTKDRSKILAFKDTWKNLNEYYEFLFVRFLELYRVLKNSGSIFVHCDRNANHVIRLVLDAIFGEENFRSEIIWTYKRWSNAKRGLLNNHQNIYFYSKSKKFNFNFIYEKYSPTTNIDQILQMRKRDEFGKSIYAKDSCGQNILHANKRGVPLSDVWDIPYLNPKARERVHYPTQKPIALLERIIQIASNEGECILDPFCGSGTTLVAAKMNNRNYIGIDISSEAIEISKSRLRQPFKSESKVLTKGRDFFANQQLELEKYLFGLDFVPVQRHSGIDAILKDTYKNSPILIKIQRDDEDILEAYTKLQQAVETKRSQKSFLIQRHNQPNLLQASENFCIDARIHVIKSYSCFLKDG